MSYAVIHQPSLLLLNCFESHRSQSWPMLSGLFCQQTGLILLVKSSMFWMALHSFSTSHGQEHTRYVLKKFGGAIVVFNGYDRTSTKDMTHRRQAKGQASVTATFTEEVQLPMKKEQFIANKTNKQKFFNTT